MVRRIWKEISSQVKRPSGIKKKRAQTLISKTLFNIAKSIEKKFRNLYPDQDVMKMVLDQNLGSLKNLIKNHSSFRKRYVSVVIRLLMDFHRSISGSIIGR